MEIWQNSLKFPCSINLMEAHHTTMCQLYKVVSTAGLPTERNGVEIARRGVIVARSVNKSRTGLVIRRVAKC
jgi:hypothetical protein